MQAMPELGDQAKPYRRLMVLQQESPCSLKSRLLPNMAFWCNMSQADGLQEHVRCYGIALLAYRARLWPPCPLCTIGYDHCQPNGA